MSLNIGVAGVDLLDDNRLQVTVGVFVTGFGQSESYTGGVSVTNAPSSDFVEIDGTVGTGAGDEHVVTLDAGLTDDDLPTEVLVTAALDDGTQEQATVEVSPGDGGGDRPDAGGITGGDVAIVLGAGLSVAYVFSQLRSAETFA